MGFRREDSKNFEWLTYSKSAFVINNISRNLRLHTWKRDEFLSNEYGKNFSLLGIFGASKIEWLFMIIACMRTNIVTVGLFDNFENFVSWANELKLRHLCTSSDKLANIKIALTTNLLMIESIIVFDHISKSTKEEFDEIGVKLINFDRLSKGDGVPENDHSELENPCFLSLTSGATDRSKFCIISHLNLISNLSGCLYLSQEITSEETYLSYMNFSVLGEILLIFLITASSGRIGVSSNPKEFIKDAKYLKPTIIVAVPRVLEFISSSVKSTVDQLSGISKSLYNKAYASKLEKYEKTGSLKHKIWDSLVFKKAKKSLGGELRIIVTGLGITNKEIVRHLKIVLGCDILEGYGLVENTVAVSISKPGDIFGGHVGGPLINIEAKLHYTGLLFEEYTNYYGELYIKGDTVSGKYYGKPGNCLDKNGWLATGDIVTVIPETGAFKFIDRIENISISRSGRYICIQQLELLYRQCNIVAQILCVGNKMIEGVIAIVVPNIEIVKKKWKSPNIERFCRSEEMNNAILREFLVVERIYKLREHEKVVKVYVETEPWVCDEVVTPTLKLKRFKLIEKYQGVISEMVQEYLANA